MSPRQWLRALRRCEALRRPAPYEPDGAPYLRCSLRRRHLNRHRTMFGLYFDRDHEGTP